MAAAALVTVVAPNVGDAATTSAPKAETLRYTARVQMTPGHGGPMPGDLHIFTGGLHRGGNMVGRYHGFCHILVRLVGSPGQPPTRGTLQCNVTAKVNGRGQIVSAGSVGPSGRGTMAVVGGKGDFKHVSGTRSGENPRRGSDQLALDLTFRLRR